MFNSKVWVYQRLIGMLMGWCQAADVSNPTRPIRTARAWNCQVYEDGDGRWLEMAAGSLDHVASPSTWKIRKIQKIWMTYDDLWWLMTWNLEWKWYSSERCGLPAPSVMVFSHHPTCQEFYAEGDQVATWRKWLGMGWLDPYPWSNRLVLEVLRFCCERSTLKLRLGEADLYHWWRGACSTISERWF